MVRDRSVKMPLGLLGGRHDMMTGPDAIPTSSNNLKKFALLLISVYLASAQLSFAADEFRNVKCGAEIPKAMIGQRTTNERIVVIEKRYPALGLKHLGADEISDRLSSINWQICGAEFIELVDRRGLVGDVLPFPAHSRQSPAFSGICQLGGRDLPDIIVAILDAAPGTELLPAVTAWKIDQQRAKFAKIPSAGLRCPKSGIYTVDGGM